MNKKFSKIHELFEFDKTNKKDSDYIIGTDEAGRGPGAGPVFAAAVCFVSDIDDEIFEKLSVLNDSKQLTEKKREELYEKIKELEKAGKCVCSVQEGSVSQIDKMNILNTSLDCMKRSCESVAGKIDMQKAKVLVDGNKLIKNFSIPQITVVKGDSKSAAIAAASILAKVIRDRLMEKLSREYPQYHWEKNKGYLSAEHIEAIKTYGATKFHRAKFLRNILAATDPVSKNRKIPEQPESQLSLF